MREEYHNDRMVEYSGIEARIGEQLSDDVLKDFWKETYLIAINSKNRFRYIQQDLGEDNLVKEVEDEKPDYTNRPKRRKSKRKKLRGNIRRHRR